MTLSSKQLGELKLLTLEHNYSCIIKALATLAREDVLENEEGVMQGGGSRHASLVTAYRAIQGDLNRLAMSISVIENYFQMVETPSGEVSRIGYEALDHLKEI